MDPSVNNYFAFDLLDRVLIRPWAHVTTFSDSSKLHTSAAQIKCPLVTCEWIAGLSIHRDYDILEVLQPWQRLSGHMIANHGLLPPSPSNIHRSQSLEKQPEDIQDIEILRIYYPKLRDDNIIDLTIFPLGRTFSGIYLQPFTSESFFLPANSISGPLRRPLPDKYGDDAVNAISCIDSNFRFGRVLGADHRDAETQLQAQAAAEAARYFNYHSGIGVAAAASDLRRYAQGFVPSVQQRYAVNTDAVSSVSRMHHYAGLEPMSSVSRHHGMLQGSLPSGEWRGWGVNLPKEGG